MQIYADVVFAINFIMDSFILWIVSRLDKTGVSVFRICFGGLIMSVLYCILIFTTEFRLYLNIFASVVIIMLGIIVSFRPKTVKSFLKLVSLSHIVAFSLGGMGIGVFYFTNITDIVGNIGGIAVENFSFKLLLSSTCLFYVVFKIVHRIIKSGLIKGKVYYRIKIFFKDEDIDVRTLVDTGNSLHDPISNNPVIIVEFNSVKDFLPDGIKLIFYEHKELNLSELTSGIADTPLSGRLRMIPFVSLGKQNGMLVGFRPDKVEVIQDTLTTTYNNVIIGIYNYKLSSSGDYQGLLNPELLHN